MRSYGVNENLVRINLYADTSEYKVTERSKEAIVKKKTLSMSGSNSIYLSGSSIHENNDLNYYTLEASVAFPKNPQNLPITSSLMGIQNNSSDIDISWATNNHHYFITIENNEVSGSRFVLSDGLSSTSYTEYVQNLYDNSVWNVCLRKKPNADTLSGVTSTPTYTLELYCVNKNSYLSQELSCSVPYSYTDGYLRHYIGARKQDLDGSTLYNAYSKFLYCNFWTDYLNNEVIISHNKDILNYGVDE